MEDAAKPISGGQQATYINDRPARVGKVGEERKHEEANLQARRSCNHSDPIPFRSLAALTYALSEISVLGLRAISCCLCHAADI